MSSLNYPFNLGITGNEFPLSGSPYWSRSTLFEIKFSTHKNYVMVGFKPGLPLQASELNEIQEISIMNSTLSSIMYSSWPTGKDDYEGVIYGPGWKGTTPLYPEPDNMNTTVNMVEVSGTTFNAKKGWYLATVPSSNLQHWIYLNSGISGAIPSETDNTYIGFSLSYEVIKPTADAALYDNSSGTQIPITGAPAGADRIKVKIDPSLVVTSDLNSSNFSPIAKINSSNVLYMNNVPVSTL
jgi:hypothetical protein